MAYHRGGPLLNRSLPFLAASRLITLATMAVGWFLAKALYSFRIHGREHLRPWATSFPPGASARHPKIIVSNHSLPLDPLMHALALFPRFTYFTFLEETALAPFLGTLIRLLCSMPIPTDSGRLDDIGKAIGRALHERGMAHFYAEGECFLLNQEIKPLKAGAFYYAIKFGVPVQPMVTVLRERGRSLGKLPAAGKKSGIWTCRADIVILPTIEPPKASGRTSADLHAAIQMSRKVHDAMQAAIDAYGGDKSLYIGPMPRLKGVNDRNRA